LWLLLLAALQLLVLWMAGFAEGPLKDKSVRYYAASRVFASQEQVLSLEEAETAWLHKLPPDRQSTLRNRLHVYAVTPLYNGVLRSLCAAWPGERPPYSYSIPVKVAFLLLFLFALGWLHLVTAPHPMDGVLAAGCLLMAALGVVVPLLGPAANPEMDLMTAPQGSAMVLILASFACFARGRGILAAVSLLLALGWHAGFAAVTVPCAIAAFGITLCDRVGSQYIRSVTAIFTLLLALLFVRLTPGPFLLYPVWIPAALVCLFLLAGPALTLDPLWRATASLAAFLLLTYGIELALGHEALREQLIRSAAGPLAAEMPVRLTGIRHLAALVLSTTALTGLLNSLLPGQLSSRARRTVLLAAASAVLAVCAGAGMLQWPKAGRKAALFLHAEEGIKVRPVPAASSLPLLDPKQEASFFAALGDFLLVP
jgi:hypothetical protein